MKNSTPIKLAAKNLPNRNKQNTEVNSPIDSQNSGTSFFKFQTIAGDAKFKNT
jgi:hypothetical protein